MEFLTLNIFLLQYNSNKSFLILYFRIYIQAIYFSNSMYRQLFLAFKRQTIQLKISSIIFIKIYDAYFSMQLFTRADVLFIFQDIPGSNKTCNFVKDIFLPFIYNVYVFSLYDVFVLNIPFPLLSVKSLNLNVVFLYETCFFRLHLYS